MNEPPTCRDLIEFLDDYVADRLDPAVRLRFDEHLGLCRHCREYLSDYRRTIALGRGAMRGPRDEQVAAAAPEAVVRAVMAAIRPPSDRGGRAGGSDAPTTP